MCSATTCTRLAIAASTIVIVMSVSFVLTFLLLPGGQNAYEEAVKVMSHNPRHQFFDQNALPTTDNKAFLSTGGPEKPAGPIKLSADGHKMRIKPVFQLEGLEGEKANILENVVIPLSIEALTRTFSLKYPVESPLLFQRKCKRTLSWTSGLKECNEVFSETVAKCGDGYIPSEMFDESSVCSGNFPGDCKTISGGGGASDTDFLLLVTASADGGKCNGVGQSGDMSAQGGFCILDDASGRPTAGFINFCPSSVSSEASDLGKQLDLAAHEILHALFFEPSLFPSFRDANGQLYENPVQVSFDPVTGQEKRTLTTPHVKEFVQNHFDCPSLQGAELENEGGTGTIWSHWEESLFYDEVMTGLASGSGRSVLSNLTLALMEDSGWFQPDYSFGGYLGFGKGAGCEFAEKKCRAVQDANTSKFFCPNPEEVSCTFNGYALGKCEVNPLANGCAIVKGFGNYLCGDIQNNDQGQKPLQVFDSYSMCVKGETNTEPWRIKSTEIGTGGRVMNVQTTYPSGSDGCFGFKCSKEEGETRDTVYVQIANMEVPCPPGSFIDLTKLGIGFTSGRFGPCPGLDVCQEQLSCHGRCNPTQGYCSEEKCHCHLGFFGHYCEQKLVPQLM